MSILLEAIEMKHPETIPVSVNILPAAWIKYGEELQKLTDRYPQFFGGRKVDYAHIGNTLNEQYRKGTSVDEWGCVWSSLVEGMQAMVTGHPVKTEEDSTRSKSRKTGTGACRTGSCICAFWIFADLKTRWSSSRRKKNRSGC